MGATSDSFGHRGVGVPTGESGRPRALVAAPFTPALERVPDGRKARLPVFNPIFFGYLAIMLGATVAAVCAIYNGILLRRMKLVAGAVVLGALAWFGFLFTVTYLFESAGLNASLTLLAGRLVHLGFGVLLARSQWAHVRGSRLLGGRVNSLLACVLVTLGLVFLLPWRAQILLLGLPIHGR